MFESVLKTLNETQKWDLLCALVKDYTTTVSKSALPNTRKSIFYDMVSRKFIESGVEPSEFVRRA